MISCPKINEIIMKKIYTLLLGTLFVDPTLLVASALDNDMPEKSAHTSLSPESCLSAHELPDVQNEYVRRANAKMISGKYQQAIDIIQQFTNDGGVHDISTHAVLCQSYMLRQDVRNAIYHFGEYFNLADPNIVPDLFYSNAATMCLIYLEENQDIGNVTIRSKLTKKAVSFLELYLNTCAQRDTPIFLDMYFTAARIYAVNGDFDKASSYIRTFFAISGEAVEPNQYGSAGEILLNHMQFEDARDYFEKYYDKTPYEVRNLAYLFSHIQSYLMLGNPEKATQYCNEILHASPTRQQVLKKYPSEWFLKTAYACSTTNQPEKAAQFIELHNKLKPNARPLFLKLRTAETLSRATKKITPMEMVKAIKQQLKNKTLERCEDLSMKIKKISFEAIDGFQEQEAERVELVNNLMKLKEKIENFGVAPSLSGAQSSSTRNTISADTALLTVQCDVDDLEKDYKNLFKKHQEAKKINLKKMRSAYLETLSHEETDLLPLVWTPNIRAQFGHAKPERTPTPAPKELAASSSTDAQAPSAGAPYSPNVTFSMLRHVPAQLEKLKEINGHANKYKASLEEIAQDPLGCVRKSRQFKALAGEKGIFSCRFDQTNRLVFRTIQTGDNDYHVIILSVFGHYKDLQKHITQSRQLVAESQASSSQKKAKSSRGRKNAPGKGKKRR